MDTTNLKEEEYIDEDYQPIAVNENETNLVTKLNSPLNLILIGLIVVVIISIVLVLIFL